MSIHFTNTTRLASLRDLHYLLLEVLDRDEPIAWYDLSFSCKEWSLNFAFAFENTIRFLELLSVIEVQKDRTVVRKKDTDYEKLKQEPEPELGLFIFRKTLAWLRQKNALHQVFCDHSIVSDLPDGQVILDTSSMPPEYAFIRSMLLNLGMVTTERKAPEHLSVTLSYRNYFRSDFLAEVFHIPMDRPKGQLAPKKPTFFISYASPDEKFKTELQAHFSVLINEGAIESWDGRAILPGEDWDAEVKKKLQEAHVVLLLVSADFMASRYINDVELRNAMERHTANEVKIIPIIVRPCDFKGSPLARYQALPRGAVPVIEWSSRDAAYADIVQQIRSMLFATPKA